MNVLQIPTLRDITLSVVIDPLSIPLRWSQLTRLSLICQSLWTDSGSLGGLDVNRGLEILRRSPNLVSCHITAHERSEPSAVNISAITLPHLESLILGGRFFLPDHISCLVLPKLRYLQIGDVSEKPFGDDSPHDSSLRAYVDPNCLSTGKLVELFRHFPMISYLTLSTAQSYRYTNVLLDEPFLALFCASYDILCPMLTHMAVMSPSAGFSDIAALALVKARMAMPCPLQQFRVHFGRSMEVDIMPELQSWISDGLQVDLQYYVPPQWEFNSREGLSAPEPSWF
ncbi:hypothetical protein B0H19DRAFT_1109384 [Mycena capillaripes]|nr:hypothetical protein B0H19DRAFT_1109384 [Mycena capillaripes]